MPRLPKLMDSSDPFSYLRVFVSAILLAATGVAILLAVSGVAPRAILLVGMFWGIYGFFTGFTDGILEPAIDFFGRLLLDPGSGAGSFSRIETLVAQGDYAQAAERYGELSREHGSVEAAVRRARLLAGPAGQPEVATRELDALRDSRRIKPADDIRIGLLLADLHEHALGEPGRAMVELRRLLDGHPSARGMRSIRATLLQLRQERFGSVSS